MSETCPTCGRLVKVVGSEEGTMHYEAVGVPVPEEAVEAARAAIKEREQAYRNTGSGRMTSNAIIGNALQAAAPAIRQQRDAELRERLLDGLEADGWKVRGSNPLSKSLRHALDRIFEEGTDPDPIDTAEGQGRR